MFKDLKNKVILITGSSRGIGFSTAKLLHSLGAKVILNSSSNFDELTKASKELNYAHFELCDVTKDNDVKEMIERIVEKFGAIDGLVNNAGGGGWASISDDDNEWQKSWDLDLMGAVHTCRYVMPILKNRKSGSVVNVASFWGISNTAKPTIASYCIAKAGLIKLTECLAREFAPNIRVNAVSPGWTNTKMLEDSITEKGLSDMKANVLLERIAEPEEIANVITFLLSDMASFITGENIVSDGGYSLKRDQIE